MTRQTNLVLIILTTILTIAFLLMVVISLTLQAEYRGMPVRASTTGDVSEAFLYTLVSSVPTIVLWTVLLRQKNKNKMQGISLGNITQKIMFILGTLCLITMFFLEKFYWTEGALKEGLPKLTMPFNIRSIIIFFSTALVFLSFVGNRKPALIISKNKGLSKERRSILIILCIAWIFLLLFTFVPTLFGTLSRENNIVEWGSAILLFGSCMYAAATFLKMERKVINSTVNKLFLALLTLGFFVMGMEEISWCQRIFKIETPAMFHKNIQHEMNLHNFATDYVENIYYFGSFGFLVILPFMRFLFPYLADIPFLKKFVPRPYIAIIGSLAFAYNFDMWNIIFSQIAFFGSLTILSTYYYFTINKQEKYIILFSVSTIIVSQVAFLSLGNHFQRLWDITEYKEFLIPVALFIYSRDIYLYVTNPLLSIPPLEKSSLLRNAAIG